MSCTTLDPGENDRTWDAGLFMEEEWGTCDGQVVEITLRSLSVTSDYIEVCEEG